MYPRVGAPLVPVVLMEVLGCERVSSRVVGALGLPSGICLGQLDERVWDDLGPDAAWLLAEDVVGCVRRQWPQVAGLQTRVSFGGEAATDLELSVRVRIALVRREGLRYGHRGVRLCEYSGLYERSGEEILRKAGHPHWEEVLGKGDATLVGVLLQNGLVMRRADLEKIAVDEERLTRGSFYLYLGSSPVLRRYARGVYGLRGHGR